LAESKLALPYYSARPAVPTGRLMREREDIERFARVEGYTLGQWFVETDDEPGSTLRALIMVARRRRAAAVIIPKDDDLGSTEETQQAARKILTEAGLRVLMLPPSGGAT
jgi:hypothetical protein